MSDFTFPTLPAPSAGSALPKQNPLLAKATVVDRTNGASSTSAVQSGGAATQPAGSGTGVAAAAEPSGRQPGDGSSAAPPPQLATQQQPRRRQKVMFEIGYSQVDWVRLTQTHPDLAGLKGAPRRRDITLEEVSRHCTEEDAWTVLRGRVYNITPYLRFHPGGVPMLLKVAGKDGTVLFNKYHAWVNAEFLLEKCLVGFLQQPQPQQQPQHAEQAGQQPGQTQQPGQGGAGGGGGGSEGAPGAMPPPPPVLQQ